MVILDACAAMKIALKTREGIALRKTIYDGEEVVVPNFFYAEFLNTLYKHVRGEKFTLEKANYYYHSIASMISYAVDVSTMSTEILSEALKQKHPAYDMAYFVLARRNAATLLTFDKGLAQICEDNGVNCVHFFDL